MYIHTRLRLIYMYTLVYVYTHPKNTRLRIVCLPLAYIYTVYIHSPSTHLFIHTLSIYTLTLETLVFVLSVFNSSIYTLYIYVYIHSSSTRLQVCTGLCLTNDFWRVQHGSPSLIFFHPACEDFLSASVVSRFVFRCHKR